MLPSRRSGVAATDETVYSLSPTATVIPTSTFSKYAGRYGLTYDQAVRLLNRKEFQEWKASLAEYVDYIATIQDPKVKALLTAQLDALSANSSISRLEALQGQIDLILNDLFDKGVAQMKNQFGDDFVEGLYYGRI